MTLLKVAKNRASPFARKYSLGNHKRGQEGYTNNFVFLKQNCHKRVFLVNNGKSEQHHCFMHIRISLCSTFPLKQTILNH